jgi:hypothetical protein
MATTQGMTKVEDLGLMGQFWSTHASLRVYVLDHKDNSCPLCRFRRLCKAVCYTSIGGDRDKGIPRGFKSFGPKSTVFLYGDKLLQNYKKKPSCNCDDEGLNEKDISYLRKLFCRFVRLGEQIYHDQMHNPYKWVEHCRFMESDDIVKTMKDSRDTYHEKHHERGQRRRGFAGNNRQQGEKRRTQTKSGGKSWRRNGFGFTNITQTQPTQECCAAKTPLVESGSTGGEESSPAKASISIKCLSQEEEWRNMFPGRSFRNYPEIYLDLPSSVDWGWYCYGVVIHLFGAGRGGQHDCDETLSVNFESEVNEVDTTETRLALADAGTRGESDRGVIPADSRQLQGETATDNASETSNTKQNVVNKPREDSRVVLDEFNEAFDDKPEVDVSLNSLVIQACKAVGKANKAVEEAQHALNEIKEELKPSQRKVNRAQRAFAKARDALSNYDSRTSKGFARTIFESNHADAERKFIDATTAHVRLQRRYNDALETLRREIHASEVAALKVREAEAAARETAVREAAAREIAASLAAKRESADNRAVIHVADEHVSAAATVEEEWEKLYDEPMSYQERRRRRRKRGKGGSKKSGTTSSNDATQPKPNQSRPRRRKRGKGGKASQKHSVQ